MQNVGETTRGIMKRLLTEDFSGRVNLESLAMLSRVLTAMTRYSQSSGLDRVEWIQIVERYKTEAFLYLAKPELHGGLSLEFPSLPISQGVLNRRVGGVFDMVTPAGRAQAYSWATARGMAWRRQETQEHDHDNFAVFHMGPGGTRQEHRAAMTPLEKCVSLGIHATFGRALFTKISGGGQAVLMTITPNAAFGPRGDEIIVVAGNEVEQPLRGVRHWMYRDELVPFGIARTRRMLLFGMAAGVL
jgi:hypothetical protein